MNQPLSLNSVSHRQFWVFLLAFIAVGTVFGFLIGYLLSLVIYGSNIVRDLGHVLPGDDEKIAALKLMQCLNHAGMFLFPSLLWMILSRGRYFSKNLSVFSVSKHRVMIMFLVSVMISYSTLPLISFIYDWNREILEKMVSGSFQEWLMGLESNSERLLTAFTTDTSTGGFIVNIIMMAVLPAVGEEFLFRGVIQNEITERTKKPYMALVLTSLIFSTVHFEFAGFLPRFLLSMILGYLFLKSGSLVFPILTHFLNNVSVVVASYFSGSPIGSDSVKEAAYGDSAILVILSVGLSALLLFMVGKFVEKEKGLGN